MYPIPELPKRPFGGRRPIPIFAEAGRRDRLHWSFTPGGMGGINFATDHPNHLTSDGGVRLIANPPPIATYRMPKPSNPGIRRKGYRPPRFGGRWSASSPLPADPKLPPFIGYVRLCGIGKECKQGRLGKIRGHDTLRRIGGLGKIGKRGRMGRFFHAL